MNNKQPEFTIDNSNFKISSYFLIIEELQSHSTYGPDSCLNESWVNRYNQILGTISATLLGTLFRM